MIKQNEIRLGILIQGSDGNTRKVELTDLVEPMFWQEVKDGVYDGIGINKIPLNDLNKVLEPFGYHFDSPYLCYEYSEGDGGVHLLAPIVYVHQLQNLILSLEGEELAINELVS